MEFPATTALLGAFLIVLQQVLMLSVGLHRGRTKTGVGVGEDRHLERKVRRHGNLAENAAIFLVVLGLAELAGLGERVIVTFAVVLGVARVFHAIAFLHLDGSHNPDGHKFWIASRVIGAMLTSLGGIALGSYLGWFLLSV